MAADADGRSWEPWARLLRTQGFIAAERDKFLDAYYIYSRSLEMDPGSPIGKRDLDFVAQTLRSRGGPDAKTLEAWRRPTASKRR